MRAKLWCLDDDFVLANLQKFTSKRARKKMLLLLLLFVQLKLKIDNEKRIGHWHLLSHFASIQHLNRTSIPLHQFNLEVYWKKLNGIP